MGEVSMRVLIFLVLVSIASLALNVATFVYLSHGGPIRVEVVESETQDVSNEVPSISPKEFE